jgi:hypothetical protein
MTTNLPFPLIFPLSAYHILLADSGGWSPVQENAHERCLLILAKDIQKGKQFKMAEVNIKKAA